jgi:hypothetical protein
MNDNFKFQVLKLYKYLDLITLLYYMMIVKLRIKELQ